jgi:cytochrome P450 family 20 subfamily A
MFSVILISIIFFLSIVWLLFHRDTKQKFDVPGVTASNPELGNLGDIGQAGSLHQYLTKLHKKFGPIVSFYWGKARVVSIASPEAFQETRRLFDRPVPLFAAFEPFIGADSIQYANGDIGRYRRKHHYDVALSPTALRGHIFDIFQRVLHEKMVSWQSNEGKPIALHAEMLALAIRSITLAAFGSSILFGDEKHIEEAYNTCWHEMEMRIQGQPQDSKGEIEFKEARNYFLQKVKEIIAKRRQREGDDYRCFIDYLLADEEYVVSEEHICDETITMFVGGFHTTGNLLTWLLYYLAKDQNVQQRLFDELVQTYDTEFPSSEQIDQMPYLSSIINESLRVSVLAPWAARVSTDDETVICGHIIPAGTPIIQALGVILQDEKIWPNPHEFNPDRFDQENKKKIPTLAFSPFGFAGQRICPGYRFAQYEASLFTAGIVRAFKVTLVDPTSTVVPVHGLVTAPKDEIFVQFNPRNS